MMQRRFCLLAVGLAVGAMLAAPAAAQHLAEFEKSVTEHRLANGMRFIIVERRDLPVVSFHLYADVGSVDEAVGQTGLAHLFEHMAFKGTSTVGTTDAKRERQALVRVDAAYAAWQAERWKGARADPKRLAELRMAFEQAQEEAERWVVTDEFSQALEEAGGVGLNATTGADATRYFISLPSNKMELWFWLESARFLDPVLRQFYKERDVVMEERRLRVESQPLGQLVEEFLAAAYRAHPYGRSGIGWPSDLENLTRAHAESFFRRHYTPPNLTAVVVGDVEAREVVRLAERYFGRIPRGPEPEPMWTEEPPQVGERRVSVLAQAQPVALVGFHKPSVRHPDDAVFDAVQDILAAGRTSRLYRSLVQEKKVAVAAGGFPGFPGQKHPNLFLFYAVAAAGRTNEENLEAMLAEIERLKTEPVSAEELERVKNRARVQLVQALDSRSGLAEQLAFYQVVTGDWRNLFRQLEKIDRVTAKDIQRVAQTYFTDRNRTVGLLVAEAPGGGAGGEQ